MKITVFTAACAAALLANAEMPYAFRQRLVTVHRSDRRDFSQKVAEGEFEFQNGAQIVVPAEAPALVRRAAEDFCDYLLVSMDVNASVRAASAAPRPGLSAAVDFINEVGLQRIADREEALTRRFYEGVKDVENITVYACCIDHNFSIDGSFGSFEGIIILPIIRLFLLNVFYFCIKLKCDTVVSSILCESNGHIEGTYYSACGSIESANSI